MPCAQDIHIINLMDTHHGHMIYISLTSVFRPLTKNIVHTTCPVCAISAPIAGQTSKGTKHEKKYI